MSFWACIHICLIKISIFCAKIFNFDQTYLNTGSKTENVEELSLDLIFHINFLISSLCKQKSKLRIYSKPDRNQWKLSVCIGETKDVCECYFRKHFPILCTVLVHCLFGVWLEMCFSFGSKQGVKAGMYIVHTVFTNKLPNEQFSCITTTFVLIIHKQKKQRGTNH